MDLVPPRLEIIQYLTLMKVLGFSIIQFCVYTEILLIFLSSTVSNWLNVFGKLYEVFQVYQSCKKIINI